MAKAGSAQKEAVRPKSKSGAQAARKAELMAASVETKSVSTGDRKRGVWNWMEISPGQTWQTPLIPNGDWCVASVKRSFSKETDGKFRYYAYRNGSILGRRDTAEEARKLAESGKVDNRKDAVSVYATEHPLDIPMFLRLTEQERIQVRKHYPESAPAQSQVEAVAREASRRGVKSAADTSDPGTVKLLAELAAQARAGQLAGARAAANDGRPASRGGSSSTSKAERAAVGLPDGAKLVRCRDGNPKKEGSAARKRWELMFTHCDRGSTVTQFLKDGGNPETLRNAVLKGFVRLEGK